MAPQAESNRVGLYYNVESSWGEEPPTPAMNELRYTGESLAHIKDTVVSNTIRSDRQVDAVAEVAASAEGDINTELRFTDYQDFIAGALQGVWTTVVLGPAATISANAASDYFETEDADALNLVAGVWVKSSGFANAGNNGYFKVISVTTVPGTPTKYRIVVDGSLTNEAVGATVTIKGKWIRNGTTGKSFHVEKRFGDITEFISLRGLRVAQMNVAVESRAILTTNFRFLGKEGIATGSTEAGSSVAAGSDDVMNATSNVGSVFEAGVALTTAIMAVRFGLNNNLRALAAIGSRTAIGINSGRGDITGQIEAYFESRALFEKFRLHTASALKFQVTDPGSNAVIFTLPKIYFTAGNPLAGAINQDVMLPLDFQAVRDPTTGCQIQIDAIAA